MRKLLTPHSLLVPVALCRATTILFLITFNIHEVTSGENTVVIIRGQQIPAYNSVVEGFEKGCKERNIFIEKIYDLKGGVEEGRKIIQSIKAGKRKSDLILTVGILATALAKAQFSDTPIIFCMVIHHERFDLQGTNITGITAEVPVEYQFAFLKELLGDVRNVGVIYDPSKTGSIISMAIPAAKKLGFNLVQAKVASDKEATSALEEIASEIDALWIIPDSTVVTRSSLNVILETALKRHLPTFCHSRTIVKEGAMVSISPDYTDIGIKAARIAQTLLNSPTASLGIKQPDKFRLSLNTQTAKEIGADTSSIESLPNVILYP